MSTVTYQRGNYIKFFAKMKIRVGGANPIDIQKGDEFDYDGSILKYSGMEVSSPQLRGAIENGWATRSQETQEEVVESIRPNRNIAKSQTVNRDLSKVQRVSERAIQTSSVDEDEVLKVSDRSANKSPKILKSEDNRKSRGLDIQSDATDTQDAVSIGRVRTSAKAVFNNVMNSEGKMKELENISNVKADLYQNKVVHTEGITISNNLGKVNSLSDADEDEVQVGTIRKSSKTSSEGITITDTSSIRSNKTTKSVSTKSKVEVVTDPRIRVARAIYPQFPNDWVFTGKLSERLAAVKSFGETPEFLTALFAAEGDQMRKLLMKSYPEIFNK